MKKRGRSKKKMNEGRKQKMEGAEKKRKERVAKKEGKKQEKMKEGKKLMMERGRKEKNGTEKRDYKVSVHKKPILLRKWTKKALCFTSFIFYFTCRVEQYITHLLSYPGTVL
jgi:hypothetical protein